MSKIYIVEVALYEEEICSWLIENICKRALRRGLFFFDEDSNSISLEEAIRNFLHPSEEALDVGGPYVHAVLDDGHLRFTIEKRQEKVIVSLDPWGSEWVKQLKKDTVVDIARYAKILLEITEDYAISSIEMYSEL